MERLGGVKVHEGAGIVGASTSLAQERSVHPTSVARCLLTCVDQVPGRLTFGASRRAKAVTW